MTDSALIAAFGVTCLGILAPRLALVVGGVVLIFYFLRWSPF